MCPTEDGLEINRQVQMQWRCIATGGAAVEYPNHSALDGQCMTRVIYQENVREDATKHARLHDANFAFCQSNYAHLIGLLNGFRESNRASRTYNKLDGIPEGSIHQASQRLTDVQGQFLRRKAKQGRQRDNGQEVENED